MFWCVSACVVAGVWGQVAPVAPTAFLAAVDEAHSIIEDVSFNYEGDYFPEAELRPGLYGDKSIVLKDNVKTVFSAKGGYHRGDGVVMCDVFRKGSSEKRIADSFRIGNQSKTINGVGATAQQSFRRMGAWFGILRLHSFARYWFPCQLRFLPPNVRNTARLLADTVVVGHRTSVIEFHLSPNGDTEWMLRCWVDLERGAHALRMEYYRNRKQLWRVHGIELSEFVDGRGRRVWLPVRGQLDDIEGVSFNEDHSVVRVGAGGAAARETYDILEDTVKVNVGRRGETFEIVFSPDRPVVDRIAAAARTNSESTSTELPVISVGPSDVVELAKRAEAQRDRLLATRPPTAWGRWELLTGILGVVGVFGTGWYVIWGRKR